MSPTAREERGLACRLREASKATNGIGETRASGSDIGCLAALCAFFLLFFFRRGQLGREGERRPGREAHMGREEIGVGGQGGEVTQLFADVCFGGLVNPGASLGTSLTR